MARVARGDSMTNEELERIVYLEALEAIAVIEEDSPAAYRAARLIAKEALGVNGASDG